MKIVPLPIPRSVLVWCLAALPPLTCGADLASRIALTKEAQADVIDGFITTGAARIHFRIAGASKPGIPLLLLHGGQATARGGAALEGLEVLADERPVIVYDQSGSGLSTKLEPSRYSIAHFVQELGQVRAALGLSRVHLLGQSWGSTLLEEYLLTQPAGVAGAIFSNPTLSASRQAADDKRLKAELPPDVRELLARHEAAGTTNAPEYKAAYRFYASEHWDRTAQPPARVAPKSKSGAAPGSPAEPVAWPAFDRERTSYEGVDRLAEIRVPALFLTGEFDFCTPETTAFYQSKLPGAKFKVVSNASHLVLREQPEAYCAAVREFLRGADSAKAP
jgi:proline iminopeptidase